MIYYYKGSECKRIESRKFGNKIYRIMYVVVFFLLLLFTGQGAIYINLFLQLNYTLYLVFKQSQGKAQTKLISYILEQDIRMPHYVINVYYNN
jgi:hypothetical protein